MTFPNESESRIAPLSTDNLSPGCVKILERLPGKGLQGEGFPYNLLGVLMYNQETLEPFLDYWSWSSFAWPSFIVASMSGNTTSRSDGSLASTIQNSTLSDTVPMSHSLRRGSAPFSNSPTPS
jgi:hypothetical protein